MCSNPVKGSCSQAVMSSNSSLHAFWNSQRPRGASAYICRLVCITSYSSIPESIATLPLFGSIEGQKWFVHFSSQWESQHWSLEMWKNHFCPSMGTNWGSVALVSVWANLSIVMEYTPESGRCHSVYSVVFTKVYIPENLCYVKSTCMCGKMPNFFVFIIKTIVSRIMDKS